MENAPLASRSIWIWVAVLVPLVGLSVMFARSLDRRGDDVTIAGAPYDVEGAEVAHVWVTTPVFGKPGQTETRELPRETGDGTGGPVTRVRLPFVGVVSVEVKRNDNTESWHEVVVRPVSDLVCASVLLLVIAILLPYALRGGRGAWYALLSEATGGYSLSRVQLLIWFLPAAVLYGALSFTFRRFVDIGPQLAVLLGLSGATTLLGTAASPSQPATPVAPVTADLQDLVNDWSSHPDVSRYQCLLLSLVGSIVMVAAFWRNLEMPTIPTAVIYLIAGSQGTYIATKAVKAGKTASDGRMATNLGPDGTSVPVGTPVVTGAPASATPAPVGTGGAAGSFAPSKG
jgi:hypothetical protein